MPTSTNVILNPSEIRDISRRLVDRIFSGDPSDTGISRMDRDLIDTKINATILEIEDAINAYVEEKIDGAITRLMDSGEEEKWW